MDDRQDAQDSPLTRQDADETLQPSDAMNRQIFDAKPKNVSIAKEAVSALPWSYNLGHATRLLVSTVAGILVGLIGMLVYRVGTPENIPYGLVLALAIVALSAWSARSRSGVAGLALHLITSSLMVSLLSSGVNGNILIPGFTVKMPFFSQNAGYIWLFGMILIQCVAVFLPARWFELAGAQAKASHGGNGRGRRDGKGPSR